MSSEHSFERIQEAVLCLHSRGVKSAKTAVILGSGLGAFADSLQSTIRVPFSEIPGFTATNVSGHAGVFVSGFVSEDVPVYVLQGRIHYYEGHSMAQVVFPVRVLAALGIERLIITNAAGGINTKYNPGELVLIQDHINMTGTNPLIGKHDKRFGERFPDMTRVYPASLRDVAHRVAGSLGFSLQEGVYAGLSGPSYETPAEIRMLRTLGADLVGMSTVSEVIIAAQAKMSVLGISCVTNMAAGVTDIPIEHSHVEKVAAIARERFVALVRGIVSQIA